MKIFIPEMLTVKCLQRGPGGNLGLCASTIRFRPGDGDLQVIRKCHLLMWSLLFEWCYPGSGHREFRPGERRTQRRRNQEEGNKQGQRVWYNLWQRMTSRRRIIKYWIWQRSQVNTSFEIVGTEATLGLWQSYFSQGVGMELCNRLRKWGFYMANAFKKLKTVIGAFSSLPVFIWEDGEHCIRFHRAPGASKAIIPWNLLDVPWVPIHNP